MKRVLMVAYHFPPLAGSSGIQRTLRFVQHLPLYGWHPMVLTVTANAYEQVSTDLLREVPSGTVVRRGVALDTARHLAFAGRYPGWLARPDRWMSWQIDGVRTGLKMIREFEPQAIWSTFPIATAHVIGHALHRRSRLPWIADFRDPMVQPDYPEDRKTRASYARIEHAAALRASALVFTTRSAAQDCMARHPGRAAAVRLIENGYDEESFAALERARPDVAPLRPGAVTLLHSGIVYPSERDPGPLMQALGRLKKEGHISSANASIRFRAPVHEQMLRSLAVSNDVEDLVQVLPPVPYADALHEMRRADALLVMQASNCNSQIPAKVYEYLRVAKPILCLSDRKGDTADLLRRAEVQAFADLASPDEIAAAIPAFLRLVGEGSALTPPASIVRAASRQERTRELAMILAEATNS